MRQASIFLVCVLILATSAQSKSALASHCGNLDNFPKLVKEELGDKERQDSSGYAVALIDPKTGEIKCGSYYNADLNVYPGSSIKTIIALAVLKRIDEHRSNLEDLLKITQSNAKQECIHWECDQYGPGKEKSVRQLLTDMIIVSNNIATNQLIEWVGKDRINKLAVTIGAEGVRVVRKVYDDVNPEPNITHRNEASAKGMVAVYREVLSGRLKILSESSHSFLVDLLLKQKYNNRLNADFPQELKFYHKTGNTSHSSSDAGFFHLDSNTAVVLVGLQGFHDYDSLRRIGRRTLSLLGVVSRRSLH